MQTQDFIIINEIIAILINAISFWLIFLVYSSDKKAVLNRLFSLMIFLFAIWVDSFVIAFLSQYLFSSRLAAENVALLSARTTLIFTALIMICAYFFSIYFPIASAKRNYVFDKIYVFFWLVLSLLSFTSLGIKKVEFQEWWVNVFGGQLILIFILAAGASIVLILSNIVKKYFLLSEDEKLRTKYFVIGIIIVGGANIVFNIGAVAFQGGNFVNPVFYSIAMYSFIFTNFLAAYAILNKKLFNIRVLLTQLLVVVMGILLLITPFLVNIPWLKTLLSMVFLLFCVFGWLLVRSSIREVRQKEILEQTVEERTKELRASKHELELNKIELEKKVQELEKWYKLTVGRELRMVELKQKIKELEGEVKGKGELKS